MSGDRRLQVLRDEMQRLETEIKAKAQQEGEPWPRRVTMYVHGSKDVAWDVFHESLQGMTEKAGGTFSYTLYEIGVDLEVNQDGTSKVLAVRVGSAILRPEAP